MNTNINEAVKPFFTKLNIDPINFNYDNVKNQFISKESFSYDDNDPEAYFVVIRISNTIGTVVIGTSDGIRFVETEILGQIMFDGKNWITV